ncbi:MFS transporter [Streptomyces sp. XM4011]|uniref:MFS transporter n=1 Tax=Streptomyces sp. XM4011 TaxID=2929780 RepID=UPI001FF709F9|nr:MFS transporter [Streptomyces sp. XM4011]MCK1812899.1 MFS transporter [Streptomyces sp. XM4011]
MNTTTRPGGHLATELTPLRRWAALAVLSASLVVIAIDMTILNVALPHITADLAPTASQQLWIVDIYSLVLAGLLVPMSAVADRFGRRRILLTGFAVFASASLAVLVADGPATLIGIRALLGIGGAMIMPTTLSMIRVIFTDPKERATALGIWAAVSSVGMAAGPVIGGFVLEHGAWQWAFLINVPLMVAALVAGLFLLPEYRSPAPPRWDTAGTLAAMAGTTALVWSIKQFADEDFTDPLGWAAFTGAALALAWFVRRCLRRPDPMLDLRLFRRPPFTAGVLAALTFMFAMGALLLLIAQWLQLVEGRSPLEAGLSLLPAVVAVGIASPLAPLLATRIGARAVLGGGLATAGLGFLTIYLAPAPLSYAWAALALVLLGAGGSSLAVGSAIIMSGTPQEKAGNAAALEETSYELGSVLGVAILGSIAAAAFRSGMDLTTLTGYGLESAQAEAARESLGAAMAVAAETGSAPLAAQAADVFTDSLARTGLVGFVALLISAALVTALVPRSLDITRQSH